MLNVCTLAFLILTCYAATAKADAEILTCFLCNLLTEETAENTIQSPAVLYGAMYKRCSQLGLIQLPCDEIVNQYAKTIVRLRRSKTPFTQHDVCLKLRLCNH